LQFRLLNPRWDESGVLSYIFYPPDHNLDILLQSTKAIWEAVRHSSDVIVTFLAILAELTQLGYTPTVLKSPSDKPVCNFIEVILFK
jgi:hypothetical protein